MTLDSRKAELVKLRYFVGMTFEETAEALGIAAADGQGMVGLRARVVCGWKLLARPGTKHQLYRDT
ncbi:MAG: sigma factor-like helix-turn-helix DNA-binding protein [Limisphaerales bacterium]